MTLSVSRIASRSPRGRMKLAARSLTPLASSRRRFTFTFWPSGSTSPRTRYPTRSARAIEGTLAVSVRYFPTPPCEMMVSDDAPLSARINPSVSPSASGASCPSLLRSLK